jgi:hypothetical protein
MMRQGTLKRELPRFVGVSLSDALNWGERMKSERRTTMVGRFVVTAFVESCVSGFHRTTGSRLEAVSIFEVLYLLCCRASVAHSRSSAVPTCHSTTAHNPPQRWPLDISIP